MTVAPEAPAAETPAADAQPAARITAGHKAIMDALKTVELAVSKRPPVPVLHGVLLDATGRAVTLRAFDYDVSLSVTVDGATGDGLSLVNHADIKASLAAAVAGEKPAVAAATPVTVADGVLSTPDLAVPLNTLDAAEYPALPPAPAPLATVDGGEFFTALARVLPAAGRDITLPALTGIYVKLSSGKLRMATTDRYRIAVAELDAQPWDGAASTEAATIVSAHLLGALAKKLGKYTGPVSFGVAGDGSGFTAFGIGAVVATMRTQPVDQWPVPALTLIPDEATPGTVTVSRSALTLAVKKADALGVAKGKGLPVAVWFGADDLIEVAPRLPENRDKVRGVVVPGEAVDGRGDLPELMHFNGSFLLDALGCFTGDTVTLHLRSETKPMLLTDGPDVAGDGYLHLMMPVRVED
jgi:DNA polymerase-3 subunit beta